MKVLKVVLKFKSYFCIINYNEMTGGMNFEKIHNHWIVCIVISWLWCSKGKEGTQSKPEEQVVNASNENIVVFPEGAVPVGEGKVKVITPDGTSENGNIPTVFIKKDTLIQHVELEL